MAARTHDLMVMESCSDLDWIASGGVARPYEIVTINSSETSAAMHKNEINAGTRVLILGTPLRGVVAERLDNVCLVFRDDSNAPLLRRVDDLESLYV